MDPADLTPAQRRAVLRCGSTPRTLSGIGARESTMLALWRHGIVNVLWVVGAEDAPPRYTLGRLGLEIRARMEVTP